MAKDSLLDELEADKANNARSRKGAVAVLSRQEAIKEAMDHGYTLTAIYSILVKKGQMPVSYESFCRLVKKYISNPSKPNNTESSPPGKTKKNHIFNPNDYDDIDKELK